MNPAVLVVFLLVASTLAQSNDDQFEGGRVKRGFLGNYLYPNYGYPYPSYGLGYPPYPYYLGGYGLYKGYGYGYGFYG